MKRSDDRNEYKMVGPFRRYEVEQLRKIMEATGRDAVSAANLAIEEYLARHEGSMQTTAESAYGEWASGNGAYSGPYTDRDGFIAGFEAATTRVSQSETDSTTD